MSVPGIAEKRLIVLVALSCMGLMFGLMWGSGAPAIALLLLAAGGALMGGACMVAESLSMLSER